MVAFTYYYFLHVFTLLYYGMPIAYTCKAPSPAGGQAGGLASVCNAWRMGLPGFMLGLWLYVQTPGKVGAAHTLL
jgi:hypothetical protein